MSPSTLAMTVNSFQNGGWSPASSTDFPESAYPSSSYSDVEQIELPSSPRYSLAPKPERPARKSTRPARKSARPARKSRPASDLKSVERAVTDAKARIVKNKTRFATALGRKHQAEARLAAEKERRKAALEKQLEDLLAVEQEVGEMASDMEHEAEVQEQELHKLLHQ